MSLLEQNTTKKKQVDNKPLLEPEKDMEFVVKGNKEYKIEAIINNAVYG